MPNYDKLILSRKAKEFASKIVVLSSRAAARDLYDLNNMIYFGLFDETDLTLLRKCAALYFAIAGDTTAQGFHFDKMTRITERTIKAELYPMIRHAEQFDFTAAKERVSLFLFELMNLNERETAFLQRFSTGRYEPQLLFENKDTVDRIANHPMAVWRIGRINEKRKIR